MNRTFKVVFNHARGCMVAVNEISRSLKKNSRKTVVATAVAAALLGLGSQAQATNYEVIQNITGETTYSSGDTFTKAAYIVVNSGYSVKVVLTDSKHSDLNEHGAGGAVYVKDTGATLTLRGNSQFTGVIASHSGTLDGGGAIFVAGTLDLIGSTFTSNHGSSGGAIYATGKAEIYASQYISNTATEYGGAIYLGSTGSLLIKAFSLENPVSFASNSAGKQGGAIYTENGGSIYYGTFKKNTATGGKGGAIYLNKGTLNVYAGTTFGDGTEDNANSADQGGAIYVNSGTAIIKITGTESSKVAFLKNTVTGNGGAITTINGGTITYANFEGNEAAKYGGAIDINSGTLSIENTTFTSNSANIGGAAETWNGTLTVKGKNTFTSNEATSMGGAIYVNDGTTLTEEAGATTTFEKNTTKGKGGAIYTEGTTTLTGTNEFTSNSAQNGGAIYLAGGTFSISGENTFTSNSATNNGGAVYVASGKTFEDTTGKTKFTGNTATANGGAIYSGGTLKLTGATFEGTGDTEKKSAENGGAIYSAGATTLSGTNSFTSNTASTSGGAIYKDGNGSFTITGSDAENVVSFTTNSADTTGGAIYTANGGSVSYAAFTGNTAAKGGAIYINAGVLKLSDTNTFTSNEATSGSGGAIFVGSGTGAEVKGTATFKDNSATGNGGAIFSAETLTVSDATFGNEANETDKGNSAASGGAIYISKGTTTLSGTNTFTGNSATGTGVTDGGGAIYFNKGTLTISGTNTFTSNSAQNGGAIYIASDLSFTIDSSVTATFKGNSATANGGAIASAGTLSITDKTFGGTGKDDGNSAAKGGAIYSVGTTTLSGTNAFTGNGATGTGDTDGGGAIYVAGGKTTLSGTNAFTANTASSNGGAISVAAEGEAEVGGTATFKGNSATANGGAIYSAGTLSVSGATFGGAGTDDLNSAANGGAIYVSAGTTTLTGSNTFTSNSATGTGDTNGGGALYVTGGSVDGSGATSVTFTSNTSAANGGAIYVGKSGSVSLTDASFTSNSASEKGGVIYLEDLVDGATAPSATISITADNTIKGNTATSGGFAYLGAGSTLTLEAAANKTLTIGEAGKLATEYDSIASNGTTSTLNLKGAGKVVINSKTSDYSGAVTVGTDSSKTEVEVAGVFSSDIRSITLGEEAQLTIEGDQTLSSNRASDEGTTISLGSKATASLKSLTLAAAAGDGNITSYTDGSSKATKHAIATIALGEEATLTLDSTGDGLNVGDYAQLTITGAGDTTAKEAKVTLPTLTTGEYSATTIGSDTSHKVRVEVTNFALNNASSVTVKNGATLATTSDKITSMLPGTATTFEENAWLEFTDEGTVAETTFETLLKSSATTNANVQNIRFEKGVLEASKNDGDLVGDVNLHIGQMTGFKSATVQANRTLKLGKANTTSDVEYINTEADDAKLEVLAGKLITKTKSLFANTTDTDAYVTNIAKKENVTITEGSVSFEFIDEGTAKLSTYKAMQATSTGVGTTNISLSNATLEADGSSKELSVTDSGLTMGATKDFTKITVAENVTFNLGHKTLALSSSVDSFELGSGSTLNLTGGTLATKAASLFTGTTATSTTPFTGATKKTQVVVANSAEVINLTDTGSATLTEYEALRTALKSGNDAKLLNVNLVNATVNADNTKDFTSDANLSFGALAGFDSLTVRAGETITLGNAGDEKTLKSDIKTITLQDQNGDKEAGQLKIAGGMLTTQSASLFKTAAVNAEKNYTAVDKKDNVTITQYLTSIALTDDGVATKSVYNTLRATLYSELDGTTTKLLKNLSLPMATLKGDNDDGSDTFTVEKGQNLAFGSMTDFKTVTIAENAELHLTGQGEGSNTPAKLDSFEFASDTTSLLYIDGGTYTTAASTFLETPSSSGTSSLATAKRANVTLGSGVDLTLTDSASLTHSEYTALQKKLTGADQTGSSASPLVKLSLSNAVLNADSATDTFSVDNDLSFGAMAGFETVTVAEGKTLTLNGATDANNKVVESNIQNITLGDKSTLAVNGGRLATMSASIFNNAVSQGNADSEFAATEDKKSSVVIANNTVGIDLLDKGICDIATYEALKGKITTTDGSTFDNLSLSNATLVANDTTKTFTVDAGQYLSFGAMAGFETVTLNEGAELTLGTLESSIDDITLGKDVKDADLNLNGGTIHTYRTSLLEGESFSDADNTALKSNVNILSENVKVDFIDAGEKVSTTDYERIVGKLAVSGEEGTTLKNVSLSKSTLVVDDAVTDADKFTTAEDSDITFGAMSGFKTVTVGKNGTLHVGTGDLVSDVDDFDVSAEGASLYLDGGILNTYAGAILNESSTETNPFTGLTKNDKVTVTDSNIVLNLKDTGTCTFTEYDNIRNDLAVAGAGTGASSTPILNVNLPNATLKADDNHKTFDTEADLTFGAVDGFTSIDVGDGKKLTIGTDDADLTTTVDKINLGEGSSLDLIGGKVVTNTSTVFTGVDSDPFASTMAKNESVSIANTDTVKKVSFDFTDEGDVEISTYKGMQEKVNTENVSLSNANLIKGAGDNDTTLSITEDVTFGALGGGKDVLDDGNALTTVTVADGKTLTIKGLEGTTSHVDVIDLKGNDSKLDIEGGSLSTQSKSLFGEALPVDKDGVIGSGTKDTRVTLSDAGNTSINLTDKGTITHSTYETLSGELSTPTQESGGTPTSVKNLSFSNATLEADSDTDQFAVADGQDLYFGAMDGFKTTTTIGNNATLHLVGTDSDEVTELGDFSFGTENSKLYVEGGKISASAGTFLESDSLDATKDEHVYVGSDVNLTLTNAGTVTLTEYEALKKKLTGADQDGDREALKQLSLSNAVLEADESSKTFEMADDLSFGAMTGFETVTVGKDATLTLNGATVTDEKGNDKKVSSEIETIDLSAENSKLVLAGGELKTNSESLFEESVVDAGGNYTADKAFKKDSVTVNPSAGIDLLDEGTCTFETYDKLKGQIVTSDKTPFENLSLSNALLKGDGVDDVLEVKNGQELTFGALQDFAKVDVNEGGTLNLDGIDGTSTVFDGEPPTTLSGVGELNLNGGRIKTASETLLEEALGSDGTPTLKDNVNITSKNTALDFSDTGKELTTDQYKSLREIAKDTITDWTEDDKTKYGETPLLNNVSLSKSALKGTDDSSGNNENFTTGDFGKDANVKFAAMEDFGTVTVDGNELHIGNSEAPLTTTVDKFSVINDGKLYFDGGETVTTIDGIFNTTPGAEGYNPTPTGLPDGVFINDKDFVLTLTDDGKTTLTDYNKMIEELSSSDHNTTGSTFTNLNMPNAILDGENKADFEVKSDLELKGLVNFDEIIIDGGKTLTIKGSSDPENPTVTDITNIKFEDDDSTLALVEGTLKTKTASLFKVDEDADPSTFPTGEDLERRNVTFENPDTYVIDLVDEGEFSQDVYETIRDNLIGTYGDGEILKHVNLSEGTLVASDTYDKTFTLDTDKLTFAAMKDFKEVKVLEDGQELHIGKRHSTMVSSIDNFTLGENIKGVYLDGGILETYAAGLLTNPGSGDEIFTSTSAKKSDKLYITDKTLVVNFKDTGTALLSNYEAVRKALNAAADTTDITGDSEVTNGDLDHLLSVNLINGTLKADGDKTFTTDADLTFGAVSGFTTLTVAKDTTLTLGNTANNLKSTDTSFVIEGTLKVAGKANNGSEMTVDAPSVKGSGLLNVGDPEGEGADMRIRSLGMTGGAIFVDPFYENAHSSLTIDEFEGGTLNTNLTTGNEGLVVIAAEKADATAALAKVSANDSSFDSVKSIVYLAKPITLGDKGSIYIDPDAKSVKVDGDATTVTLKDGTTYTPSTKSVYVADYGALVLDQKGIGSDAAIQGAETITFEPKAVITVVNADEGTIDIGGDTPPTTPEGTSAKPSVNTDNPYYEGHVDDKGKIVVEQSAANGNAALASAGIQALVSRAGSVLSDTIQTRSYEERELGASLWVDVGGESYKATSIENGASFKSDMGYGVMGADYAFGNGVLAGAAFQYGKGTARGGVDSVKNKVKNYAGMAYAVFGTGKAKFVVDTAYIKQDNSITSSKEAFNQKADSSMFVVGVTGRMSFKAGAFDLTPSIGARVSKIKTDTMRAGNIAIPKQNQTLFQTPIALRVKTQTTTQSGWAVEPSMRLAIVPTFGDTSVRILDVDQQVIDKNPVQADLGVAVKKGKVTIDAKFSYGAGSQGTSSVGGKIGLRYLF